MATMANYIIVSAIIISTSNALFLGDEASALLKGNLKDYVNLQGLNLDIIEVETSDGWLLQIHRVRNLDLFNKTLSTPVLIAHGFASSSMDFMVNMRNESLPFILADKGYDVWLPNFRGNKFSNQVRRDGLPAAPDATDYYRMTWQYMAERDLPAILDRVLQETGAEKIFTVGHSMGGSTFFALLSENHAYDDKIAFFFGLSPVLRFDKDSSFKIRLALKLVDIITKFSINPFFRVLAGRSLFAARVGVINTVLDSIRVYFSYFAPRTTTLITNALFQRKLIDVLRDNPHLRKERLPIMLTNYPAGLTWMETFLYAQEVNQDSKGLPWKKMDYDNAKQTGITNMGEYNQPKPPAYDFSAVKVRTLGTFVKNDIFLGVKTVERLISNLHLPANEYSIVDGNNLSHQDELWGWDARCWVFGPLIKAMEEVEAERAEDNSDLRTYRTEVVPALQKTLSYENGCAGLSEAS